METNPVAAADADRARLQRIKAKLLNPGLTDADRRRILLQLRPEPVYVKPEPPKSAPLPRQRKSRYWSEKGFRELFAQPASMDRANDLCEKYFMPLATGWCASKAGIGNHEAIGLDEAVQVATIVCLSKLDMFDPARGTAFNFFSKVCQNAIRIENNRELKHRERFVCESELTDVQGDDD